MAFNRSHNLKATTVFNYEKDISFLDKDTTSITKIKGNLAAKQLEPTDGYNLQYFLTSCGQTLISLNYTSKHTGSLLIYSNTSFRKETPLVIPNITVNMSIGPREMVISENEDFCVVAGLRNNRVALQLYRINLCGDSISITTCSTCNLQHFICPLHKHGQELISVIKASNRHIVVFTKANHMFVYRLGDTLAFQNLLCLQKTPRLGGCVTSACWTMGGSSLVFITSCYQVFSYSIFSLKLKYHFQASSPTEDMSNEHVTLQKVAPSCNSNTELFVACAHRNRIIFLFTRNTNNDETRMLSKFTISSVIEQDDNRFAIKHFSAEPYTGKCYLLLHEYETKMGQVFGFNVFTPYQNRFVIKYESKSLAWPEMLINWKAGEVLLMDSDGGIHGQSLPLDTFSLADMAKKSVKLHYSVRQIHHANIPISLRNYILS